MNQTKGNFDSVRLYALLTEAHCRGPWLETAERLLSGGVDVIQLREKGLSDAEMLRRARTLRALTREYGKQLVINDRPDVAMLADADGVHLGQDDLPIEEVRNILPKGIIIGLSTHTVDQAAAAQMRGADYIGVGPAFATETKGYEAGGGGGLVRRLCAATNLPTVAIGGIDQSRIATIISAGARAIAACGALCGAADPEQAAREMREAILEAQEQ